MMHRLLSSSWIRPITAISTSLITCTYIHHHITKPITCAGPAPSTHAYHSNPCDIKHEPKRPSGCVPRLVYVITRHGARTPINLLPTETPETFAALWGWCRTEGGQESPCQPGFLTPLGESQMFTAGSYLRHLYITRDHLIPSTFDAARSHLIIRSTDSPRTRMSGGSLVQGLFVNQVSRDAIRSMMKVYTLEQENLFPNYPSCRRVHELYAGTIATPMYQSILHSKQALSTRAALCGTGKIFAPHTSWINMADEFRGRLAHNLPLPVGTYEHVSTVEHMASTIFENITCGSLLHLHHRFIQHSHEDIADIHDVHMLNPRYAFARDVTMPNPLELLQMGTGNVWREMFDGMTRRMKGDDTTRLVVLSGHDVTIQPLMQSLRMAFSKTHAKDAPNNVTFINTELLDATIWPPFASMLQIELLQHETDTSQWYINIINNQQPVLIASANVFINHMSSLYPTENYLQQCQGQTTGEIPPHVW